MRRTKRSIRRSHKARMKRKARRIYPMDENAHKLADNLAFCNRWCCTLRDWNRRDFVEEVLDKEVEEWAQEELD